MEKARGEGGTRKKMVNCWKHAKEKENLELITGEHGYNFIKPLNKFNLAGGMKTYYLHHVNVLQKTSLFQDNESRTSGDRKK